MTVDTISTQRNAQFLFLGGIRHAKYFRTFWQISRLPSSGLAVALTTENFCVSPIAEVTYQTPVVETYGQEL